jgi:hypothetical protein
LFKCRLKRAGELETQQDLNAEHKDTTFIQSVLGFLFGLGHFNFEVISANIRDRRLSRFTLGTLIAVSFFAAARSSILFIIVLD